MKTLPKNISEQLDGYVVRIRRGDLKWRAFVPHSRPDALAEAVRLRDRFYEVVPAKSRPRFARSNTDVVGICETTVWKRGLPYSNFLVRGADRRNRRFYFGRTQTRTKAFKLAVAHRARSIGKTAADILPKYEL